MRKKQRDDLQISFFKQKEKYKKLAEYVVRLLSDDPSAPKDVSLQYSGYSSTHYQVKLGKNSDASQAFKSIQIELQLRTILEEAWGEIDHKYRYSRIGNTLPEHIHSGLL